ncbi:MAG: PAAR-like domain-containing protein [Polyangiales bacterium]
MFPVMTKAGGECLAVPDVCKVPAPPAPPVPTPFPNQASFSSATGEIDAVVVENKEVVVMTSKIPSSKGDEAGTAGGVISGVNRGEATFKIGSERVFAKGKKVVLQMHPSSHNGGNVPVGQIVTPSQTKVFAAF